MNELDDGRSGVPLKSRPTQHTKVVLEYPVELGSEVLTELEIRRPKGRDYKKMPPGIETQPGLMLDWAAHLAGVPPSYLDDLDCTDVNRVLEVVSDFFDVGLETGDSS